MIRLPCLHASGKWGYIDQVGRWVIEPVYDFASSYARSNIASVVIGDNGRRTLVDIKGRNLFAPRPYQDLIALDDGYAIAETDSLVIINRLGEEIWSPQCENLDAAGPGLFIEWLEPWDRCRLVRMGGVPVIDKEFHELSVYAQKRVVLAREETGYVLMDFGSNVLRSYSHIYDSLSPFDERGRAVFSSQGMCGVISEDESLVLPPIFRSIDFCFGRDKTMVVCRDGEDGPFGVYDATNCDFVGGDFEYVAPATDENLFWGFNGSWSLYRKDGSCMAHDVCMELVHAVEGVYQGLVDGDGRMFYGFIGAKGLETVRCQI